MRPHPVQLRTTLFLLGICLQSVSCSTQLLPGEIAKDKYFEQGIDARIRSNGTQPQLGLALAGGGTKAGNFAIGVLQGLTEAEVMGQVDAVSTVSGGGYAALWYFSRLLNSQEFSLNSSSELNKKQFAKTFFTDCIPWRYVHYKFISTSQHYPLSSGPCPQGNLINFERKNVDDKEHRKDFENDEVRYQNHLRGYQDVFAVTRPFSYLETTRDKGHNGLDMALSSVLVLGSAVLNVVPNILFDWEIPISSSRWQYESGIARTFGATPTNCAKTKGCTPDTRPSGSETFVRNDLTFEKLREEYAKGSIPLWIINATAGENRDLFSGIAHPGQKPLQLTTFEFSPYGSGSGLFRYSSHSLGDIKPWEAVTISAAFLDAQQKIYPVWWNIGLNATTLNWGRSFHNPHIRWFETAFHKLLPVPLYLLHRRSGNSAEDFVNIRLSDGGQSEDLGVYALIQRKLPDMIVSDHSSDRSGRMEDVCRVKNGLANEHGGDLPLYIYFPGLSDLDKVCDRNSQFGYDVFNWEHPIVLGCVTSDRDNTNCIMKGPREQAHFQHVYLIKPSLPSSKSHRYLGEAISGAAKKCKASREDKDCTDEVKRVCNVLEAGKEYPLTTHAVSLSRVDWPYEEYVSCELLAFTMIDAWTDPGFNNIDRCPHHPQGSTEGITVDSSPFIFGFYRELGRYYARQLGWFFGKANEQLIGEQLKEERYQHAIFYQGQNPIVPQPISTKHTKAGKVGDCLK